MNCSKPILALDCGIDKDTGKKRIMIVPTGFRPDYSIEYLENKYGKGRVLKLPCGRCPQCLENKRVDWSVRCDMESHYHEKSCFLTLTYRDEVCPRWVSKEHLRRFLRGLRRAGIKYDKVFACGEYGELNHRPHMHLILFGYFPDDAVLKVPKGSRAGFDIYESKTLLDIWNKGFVDLQDASINTAFYVAGYVNKKVDNAPAFLLMSRGIGDQYMIDNFEKLYVQRLYQGIKGHVFCLPRRFKQIAAKLGYKYEEDPEAKIRMRKLENSEMVQRKLMYREELFGYGDKKMKDKLEKRLNRL